MRQALWVDQLGQDLRYALTLLTRDRAFTLVAALALALGIAATTSLITVVNAVILRGLPLADPDRLVAITMRDPRNRQLAMSSPDFDDWQRASRSFSGMTIMLPVAFSVSDHNHLPEQFFGPYTSTNLFTVIGQRPLLGRDFTPEDDRPGAAPVVILWIRHLADALRRRSGDSRANDSRQRYPADGRWRDAARHAIPAELRPVDATGSNQHTANRGTRHPQLLGDREAGRGCHAGTGASGDRESGARDRA